MNKYTRLFGVVLVLVLLAASGGQAAAQQGDSAQYFPGTGHNLGGEFLAYYQGVPNAAYIFGEPITEQFTDARSGRVVQYFQRARFEYYPEYAPGQRVKLTDVGSSIFQRSTIDGALDAHSPMGCRYFAQTGYSLCYAFLEFFDSNGGEAIFGKPISPFVSYNGRVVQFFERARFEWFPENPEGQKVSLAELGRIYFDNVPEDANRLQAVRAENTPGEVLDLLPRAFTWKAVTRLDDTQAIYVVVQDQTLRPVAGATAVITIHWPQGGTQSLAQTTDRYGVMTLPLQVQGQPHGSLVLIDVEVLFMGFSKHAQTSFRVWQ